MYFEEWTHHSWCRASLYHPAPGTVDENNEATLILGRLKKRINIKRNINMYFTAPCKAPQNLGALQGALT